ncbi:MAG: hypothetical protein R2734_04460 [Nocardioides sp.]
MIAGANQKGSPVSLNYQYVGPTYVTNAFGSTVAGPMWGQAMHAIQGMLKSTPFTRPTCPAIPRSTPPCRRSRG